MIISQWTRLKNMAQTRHYLPGQELTAFSRPEIYQGGFFISKIKKHFISKVFSNQIFYQ
jgi:hypothetical protein